MISSTSLSLIMAFLLSRSVWAAAFFIQGTSLTWNHPKAESGPVYRPTRSITKEENNVYKVLSQAKVVDPQSGEVGWALDEGLFRDTGMTAFWNKLSSTTSRKALVVVMPQLGDFESTEYASMLKEVLPDLNRANIALRIVGVGSCKTAHMFSLFTGIPLEHIRVDPTAQTHAALGLHKGPDWEVPSWIPEEAVEWFAEEICGNDNKKVPADQVVRSWMNYMAMCTGIAAPGTLREILRGYFGDRSSPEMLHGDETIHAGPLSIKGTREIKFGPFKFKNFWRKEEGYLRPAELATIRLRSMVEVLTKFEDYVPDQRWLDWRGATFLLDESCERGGREPLYEFRNPGVLTYSETMSRPLSFLENFIGMSRARNPGGLKDPDFEYV